jgi:hypothetical protein
MYAMQGKKRKERKGENAIADPKVLQTKSGERREREKERRVRESNISPRRRPLFPTLFRPGKHIS